MQPADIPNSRLGRLRLPFLGATDGHHGVSVRVDEMRRVTTLAGAFSGLTAGQKAVHLETWRVANSERLIEPTS